MRTLNFNLLGIGIKIKIEDHNLKHKEFQAMIKTEAKILSLQHVINHLIHVTLSALFWKEIALPPSIEFS